MVGLGGGDNKHPCGTYHGPTKTFHVHVSACLIPRASPLELLYDHQKLLLEEFSVLKRNGSVARGRRPRTLRLELQKHAFRVGVVSFSQRAFYRMVRSFYDEQKLLYDDQKLLYDHQKLLDDDQELLYEHQKLLLEEFSV